MRRIVPMLCAALAACSAGDASDRHVGPAVAANDRHASPTVAAPASPERLLATPASLKGGVVISLDDLETRPELARERAGLRPARDRNFSSTDLGRLPPGIADALRTDSYQLGIAPEDDLTIASTAEAGDWIALVFGDTSVVDARSLTHEVDEPAREALDAVPGALPAAPVESLR